MVLADITLRTAVTTRVSGHLIECKVRGNFSMRLVKLPMRVCGHRTRSMAMVSCTTRIPASLSPLIIRISPSWATTGAPSKVHEN
jgi:hypothetical protein